MSDAEEDAPAADGGEAEPARRVEVGPDDVWQPGAHTPARWAHRSILAPVLMVVLISSALVYGFIAVAGLAWRLLR